MSDTLFCGHCMEYREYEVRAEREHYSFVAGVFVDETIIANIAYCTTCGEQIWSKALDDATLLKLYEQVRCKLNGKEV